MAESEYHNVTAENYSKLFPQPGLDSHHTTSRLEGKVAIVTGGNSGIGRATVERFSNDGASVAILAQNEERGLGLQNELVAKGKRVRFYKVDVSDKEQCLKVVQQVADDNGGMIHYLVNNAANFIVSDAGEQVSVPLMEVTPSGWNTMMSVNVVGISNMAQACVPFMKKDGKNCAVVNIGSNSAYVGERGSHAYNSSKAAVLMLTKCMAIELSDFGIRVNSVSPGWTWTPAAVRYYGEESLKVKERVAAMHMTGCLTEASGVAATIVFLCSQDARFIDGIDIPVDGGFTSMGPHGLGTFI